MLSADRAAFCCVSQLVTEGRLADFFYVFFYIFFFTYNCHCFDCRAITRACLEGAIDVQLAVKAQKPPTRHLIAKHPLCRVNLSLTAHLSLIIASWHLWRGGEIDSGGWAVGSELVLTV